MTEIVMDSVSANATIGGDDYEVIETSSEISRYSETDKFTVTVIDRDFDVEPRQSESVEIFINDTKVFTGFVNRVKFNDDGSFEVMALNDLYYTKAETTTLSITEEPVPISQIVEEVCEDAGVDYEINLNWIADEVQEMVEEGDIIPDAINYNVKIEVTEKKCSKVLDTLAKWSNADWWFDNENVLQFGLPNSQLHKLEYITNASAAEMLPPYRGVVVVGNSIVSQFGWAASKLEAEFPLIAERGIIYDEEKSTWTVVDEALEPTFTLKDKQIKTSTQAEAAANKLAQELFKQIKGGTVEFVGTKRNESQTIDALDVIEMPDRMGSERYFIGKLNHKITGSDGYRVNVECEGLVPDRYGVDRIVVES